MAGITIESGPRRGERFELRETEVVTVGRDPRCTIELSDGLLSRVHCIFRATEGRWRVIDQKSLNLVYVNNTAVTQRTLAHGDTIRTGETLFSFSEDEEDPLVGSTLAGYRVDMRLGRGSMGTVYLARQLSIDRPVALKILAPRLAEDASFVARFLQEARAAGRLNHPRVIQVYDAGEETGHHYISMEYLEGGTLEQLLDSTTSIPPAEAVALGMDAAEGLTFAERHGIVHRDIKPANLLLDVDGHAKVGDLGIAVDLQRTQVGGRREIAGSPAYMAPEQARGDAIDHRADIYALGGTLYRALAGEAPFPAPSVREVLKRKLTEDPPPLFKRNPEVSRTLSAVVHKMLARNPNARFSSAEEVQKALETSLRVAPRRRGSVAARHGGVARPAAARAPVATRRAARSSSISPTTIALMAAVPIALIVILILLQKGTTPPQETVPPLETVRPTGRQDVASSPDSRLPSPTDPSPGVTNPPPRTSSTPDSASPQKTTREDPSEETSPAVPSSPDASSLAVIDARIDEARKELDKLLSESKFAEAYALLEPLESRLPPIASSRIGNLRERIALAEARDQEVQASIPRLFAPIRRVLADLDFEKASKLLEAFVAKTPEADRWLGDLRAEIASTKSTWELLAAKLDEAVSGTSAREMEFVQGPLEEAPPGAARYRVQERDVDRMRLKPSTARANEVTRSVFALEPKSLLDLAGAEVAEDTREALVRLVLLRRGPKPATALLEAVELPAPRKEACARAIEETGDVWLSTRLARLQAQFAKWQEAGEEPPADSWDWLATETAELFVGWRERPGIDTARPELRKLFVAARERALRGLPLEGFFHARYFKEMKDGIVQLRYDFSTREQLDDFVPVKGLSAALLWIKQRKVMKVAGEVRFLKGDPFVSKITVTGTTAPAGFAELDPNINVAIWTREEDAVTPTLDGRPIDPRRWMDANDPISEDYFVFGTGFVVRITGANVDDRGLGRGLGRFIDGVRSWLPSYLRQPTHVILAGQRGQSILRDRRELVWEAAAGDLGRGPVQFTVQIDPERVRWLVNRKPLPLEESLQVERVTANPSPKGSVTLFTNGRDVHYAGFEVTGELNPEWLEGRRRAIAAEELAKLDPPAKPATP